ncbi:MAG TPA: formyltransferase family protein [Devosia sp.]|jgi:methionyl-tRNA formyltransferase|uniref:methionyl-tRNA formyltransferase n=1 Tax=Devosia sp. TaxID=1871048 RepID=UPI002F9213DF
MRVVVITQGVSRVVAPLMSSGHEVIGIAESAPRGASTARQGLRAVARRLVGRAVRRLRTLEQYAADHRLPYFWLTRDSMAAFSQWLRQLRPDVLVVFSMSQLLPPEIFNLPPKGTINLHPSYLPEYRGPLPDFWQYRAFVPHAGVTVHYIDAGEDTGDIIYQERVPVAFGTRSPEWLDLVVGRTGSQLLVKALDDIESRAAPRLAQPGLSPTIRARQVKAAEHGDMIDWANWPIDHIWHVLRGTEGWLNALPRPSGLYTGQRWTIGEVERGAGSDLPATVGKDDRGHYVACRDGRIRLSLRFSPVAALRHFLWRR